MKKIFTIIVLAALSLTAFAQQKKVAVYVTGEDAGINKVLGSKLVSAIARSNEFSAIERTESFLAELSKEQNYQRTGAVDDSELSRLGKQFGVQYICVAAVSDAFNEKYLSARLIDVETAQVERTASSSGAIQSLDGIVAAANSVSNDLLSSLGKGRQSNLKKVAVYVIKNEAGRNIGRVLGDKLVAGFTNSGRYIAIERTNSFLAQLNKEQNYQHSGAVDDSDLSRLGKQFGVQYVCVADVSDVFGEKYISARLIDVETAEVVNTHDIGGEMNSMSSCLRMANDIAANLSKGTFAEQAEEARLEAIRREQERQRQLEEERLAEQRRKEAEARAEQQERQAKIDRDWRELLDSRILRVDNNYSDSWYIGGKDKDGKREGYGLYFWKDDRTMYFGNFHKGNYENSGMYIAAEGKSVANCPKGMVYVGDWRNDHKAGKGTVYKKDGTLIYYGNFMFGKPIETYPANVYSDFSFGVINYDNGNKYVGELLKGKRHGKGMFIWAEGSGVVWYGEWKDGKRDGYGIYIYDNGAKYTKGTWKGDTKL
ncbi:MAG: hypothetical protein IJS92_03675 [Paludibacteraceae bacterium]|nr:hypothetical protein [Paludibacteraceae bacterium]